MKIKQEIKKWKNSLVLSLALALFFTFSYFHNWANSLLIKLHFCDHTFCMIFAIVFVVLAYLSNDKKKSYIKIVLIALIVGIILMNIIVCTNGEISLKGGSLKELFTTYPTITQCKTICQDEDWDTGFLTKVPDMCLEDGDLLVTDREMLISRSLYISPCCCYNIDTCEDLGYISRTPEGDIDRYEEIEVGKLICWEEKEIIELKIICCEIFNLNKIGEKVDVFYDLMTNNECNRMLSIYDGVNIVSEELCEK